MVFVSRSDHDVSSAAKLFDLLWESVADVLGTAATATLLRRAIKRAASKTSWPEPITVARNGLDYEYRLPETWKQPGSEEAMGALRVVAAELRVLLVERPDRLWSGGLRVWLPSASSGSTSVWRRND
jgi:hypothetical protein